MSATKEIAPKKSDETRARILEAALTLFRKHGFEKTTMRNIAREAGVALGAAYYYFDSKDALVMGFYERAQDDLSALLGEALPKTKGLQEKLHTLLSIKFDYFQPNRELLRALSGHIDPEHPLSPFSEETRTIREKDVSFFANLVEDAGLRIPHDLRMHLPRLLWMYQMGLLLFWIYDRSPRQVQTKRLFEKSLSIVVNLIKLSGFPLLRPVRKIVTNLLEIIVGADESAVADAAR